MIISELIVFCFQHPFTTQFQSPKTALQASKPQANVQDLDRFKLLVHFSLPMRDPLRIHSKPAFKHPNPAISNLTSSWAWSAEIEHLFTPTDDHAFPSSSSMFLFTIDGLRILHSCRRPPENPAKYDYAGRCRIPMEPQRLAREASFKPTTNRSSKVIHVCSYSCRPQSSKEEKSGCAVDFTLVVARALQSELVVQRWTLQC